MTRFERFNFETFERELHAVQVQVRRRRGFIAVIMQSQKLQCREYRAAYVYYHRYT